MRICKEIFARALGLLALYRSSILSCHYRTVKTDSALNCISKGCKLRLLF